MKTITDASSLAESAVVEPHGIRDLPGVFSYHDVIPLINNYIASIEIDDDHPALLFNWQLDNVNAFVDAANAMKPPPVFPQWLRTPIPQITSYTLVDDIMTHLGNAAGGRFGIVLLAPNTMAQYGAIMATLGALHKHPAIQQVAQVALQPVNGEERLLAETATLTEGRHAHYAVPNAVEIPQQIPPAVAQARRVFL